MHYEIIKLDRRHANHEYFKYCIEFSRLKSWAWANQSGTGILDFDKSRKWFNTVWGWGQDVELQQELRKASYGAPISLDPFAEAINPRWAYSAKYKEYRIYVRGDEELAFYQLSHIKGQE